MNRQCDAAKCGDETLANHLNLALRRSISARIPARTFHSGGRPMNRVLRILLVIVASGESLLTASVSRTQEAAEKKHWSAQWITAAGVAERDEVVLHFRKTIELKAAPAKFSVDVSADNQFILYVNGVEAGRGPSRADLAHWRYETYEIGPLLHSGRNVISAMVWHFGTRAAIAQMSDRVGFLLHGATDRERTADTDASWEVEEETGISAVKAK